MDAFKIAYVGGGSRFVVTLLHGLASQGAALGALGRPIELALLDPNAERAGEMARYAEITARQTGLPIRAAVTARQEEAVEGAGWVLFSAGLWEPASALRKRFLEPMGHPNEESGPGVAVEAAAVWPFLQTLAGDIRKRARGATFSTLVNPTDVLAAAFETAFGIPSIGICVEVPGLVGFLSYYLQVPESEIAIQHAGVNHVGWVSRWSIAGRDGAPLFWERIPARMQQEDWYPHPTFFVDLYRATGFMRSSPYHNWPYRTDWPEEFHRRNERWAQVCLGGRRREEIRRAALEKALAEGRMIPQPDETRVHPEAMPYTYPNTRHTLGALAVGLAGGESGPVPLQVRNGAANPFLPADAWVEVPARVSRGKAEPLSVPPLPEWLFGQTAALARQRRLIADWLAGRDPGSLAKGLLVLPDAAPLPALLELASGLENWVRDPRGR